MSPQELRSEDSTRKLLFSFIKNVQMSSAYIDEYLRHNYTISTNELRFEWDPIKTKANVDKHGVSFEEAATVFGDYNAILFYDPDHSEDEDRLILLGMSIEARLLIVCHCLRESETVIRIISARKATKSESMQYAELNEGW